MNDFLKDKQFGDKEYRNETQGLLRYIAGGREPYFLDGPSHFERTAQTKGKYDVLIEIRPGVLSSIEIKTVREPEGRPPYTAIYAETESCSLPGMVTPGWMRESEAEFLLYGLEDIAGRKIKFYLYQFPPMKLWFWDQLRSNSRRWPIHRNQDENQTQGRIVPFADIPRHFLKKRYDVSFDGGIAEISLSQEVHV